MPLSDVSTQRGGASVPLMSISYGLVLVRQGYGCG